jgi:CTP:molybdopterin cytidylyltransferase MocA
VTVAAVVVAETADSALVEVLDRASVRRIAEVAWAGGAMPIVVVCDDPAGAVAAALAGSEATLADPGTSGPDPISQLARGVEVAVSAVAETDAVLVWPASMTWVDPETVTSLIQAHGISADQLLRPTWETRPGWPVLVPKALIEPLGASLAGDDRTFEQVVGSLAPADARVDLDLGDPGAVIGREVPMVDLPAYQGPSGPLATPPDWGAAAAEQSDDQAPDGPPAVMRR